MRSARRTALVLGLALLFGIPIFGLVYSSLLQSGAVAHASHPVTGLNYLELALVLIPLGLLSAGYGLGAHSWAGWIGVVGIGLPSALASWLWALVSLSEASGNPF